VALACSVGAALIFSGRSCRPKAGSHGVGTAGAAVSLAAVAEGGVDDFTAYVQIQSDTEHEERSYMCGRCSRSPHLRACILQIVVDLGLMVFFSGQWGSPSQPSDDDAAGYNDGLGSVWVLWLFIGLYIADCLACKTRKYLSNVNWTEDTFTYVSRLKDTGPTFAYGVVCYHYETRVITETYTDSSGNTQTRTRTETERVNTFTGSDSWIYARFEDHSGELTSGIVKYQVTKIDYSKSIVFGDTETEQHYNGCRDTYYATHDFDTHQDTWERWKLPGFTEHQLSLVNLALVPPGLGLWWYLLFSLVIPVSALYRIWLERMSVSANFLFRKRVFISAVPMGNPLRI